MSTDDDASSNASPATPVNDIEADLRDEFLTGLGALRRERPDARAVEHQGNQVFVYLGVFDLSAFDGLEQDEAEAYVRVPHQFPDGQPYGFVTDPALTRSNGGGLPAQDVNHSNAQALTDVVDGDFGWWSFRWHDVRVEQGADLAKAVELVRSHIRRWEDGNGN